jgi:hypothetical protein
MRDFVVVAVSIQRLPHHNYHNYLLLFRSLHDSNSLIQKTVDVGKPKTVTQAATGHQVQF